MGQHFKPLDLTNKIKLFIDSYFIFCILSPAKWATSISWHGLYLKFHWSTMPHPPVLWSLHSTYNLPDISRKGYYFFSRDYKVNWGNYYEALPRTKENGEGILWHSPLECRLFGGKHLYLSLYYLELGILSMTSDIFEWIKKLWSTGFHKTN